jgi:hypothetical protein
MAKVKNKEISTGLPLFIKSGEFLDYQSLGILLLSQDRP